MILSKWASERESEREREGGREAWSKLRVIKIY